MSCCLKHCSTKEKPSKRHPNPVKRQLFPFPDDDLMQQYWLEAIHRESWKPKPNSKLCEVHFHPLDLLTNSSCNKDVVPCHKKKLAPGAIPILNLLEEGNY